MEILILGILLGAGAAKRKTVTKALVKGYLAVAETSSHMRADLREAINEAKTETEKQRSEPEPVGLIANEEITALQEEAANGTTATTPTLTVVQSVEASEPTEPTLEFEPEPLDSDATTTPKPSVSILKGVAKSFMRVTEMTRSAAAHVREDLRDAVEEAKYERELAASKRAITEVVEMETSAQDEVAIPTPKAADVVTATSVKKTTTRKTPKAAPATAHADGAAKSPKAEPVTPTKAPAAKKTPAKTMKAVVTATPETVVSLD